MTEASERALEGLRDLSTVQWYVIPLLAIVFYIYNKEIAKARRGGDWNAVCAGLIVFGLDFFNETWNGWVLAITGRSAVWTAPGPTALRTLVGWNIEIMFMFTLLSLVYYYALSNERGAKVLGIPEKWFWAVAYAAFCVFIEALLNRGGQLVWEYPFWNRSLAGIWAIFLVGYLPFLLGAAFVISLKSNKAKAATLAVVYAVPIAMNVLGFGVFGWNY